MATESLSIESSMGEILDALPGARRALFARYHLGGCQSCGFPSEESLKDLAKRAGDHDPNEMLNHLLESHKHDIEMLISPTEAKSMLDTNDPTPLLVDTRTREEHEAVSIPDSLFMNEELQQSLFAGNPDLCIILYDHTGKHVLDHCSWFRGHGLKKTYAIEGGIDAWAKDVDNSIRRYRLEIE